MAHRLPGNVAWLAALLLAPAPATLAHDDLPKQIAAVTRAIADDPGSAALHERRGELHRRDGAWDAALADLETARLLAPDNDTIDLGRARVLRQGGWPRSALRVVDHFLTHHAEHPGAHLIRARALVDVRRFAAAVPAYDAALAGLPRREPEVYVERARAAAAAGDVEGAIGGLDRAIEDLGTVVSLVRPAIEYEVALGAHDAALARVATLKERAQRRERWLKLEGDVLTRAGRIDEALDRYAAARAAIARLPARHRTTRSTRDLAEAITNAVDRIRSDGDSVGVRPHERPPVSAAGGDPSMPQAERRPK